MDYLTPDNREVVALAWLLIGFGAALSVRGFRASVGDLFRTALRPPIVVVFVGLFGYVALEVWIASQIGVWGMELLKPTLLWLAFSGIAMPFAYNKASEPRFFRNSIKAALGITVFLEFFTNVAPMELIWEFALQPVVFVLAMMSIVAANKDEHRSIKKAVEFLLALLGFSLAYFTIRQLYLTSDGLDKHGLMFQLALPIWLTVGLLPFVYGLSLYANYDNTFTRINRTTSDRKARLREKLALLSKLHFRTREVEGFGWHWLEAIAGAPSFFAARNLIAEFQEHRKNEVRH